MVHLLIGTAAATLAVMVVAFLIGVVRRRHDGVDVAWGVGFAVVSVVSALGSDGGSRWLVCALTVVWGLRLAVHIACRQPGSTEDPRYVEMLSSAPGNRDLYAFRVVYLTQGAFLWFISLPVPVAAHYAPLTWWALAGGVVWAFGFLFEMVGDWQLARFRGRSSGRVLDTGLWRYTRHPNYFGDACVWWGLFLLACQSWVGALAILSPALMTYLLAGRTGKPLMEQHLNARPGYADYVARTSGFIPRPPR
jgi:steroid 5-alpha reductase family enzyme